MGDIKEKNVKVKRGFLYREGRNTMDDTKKQAIKTGIGIVVGVLIAIYVLGIFVFHGRFYFRSYINGINYGGKTVKQVEMQIAENISQYKLTIYERDGKQEEIKASDIGLTYVSDGTIQKLKDQQSPFNWLFGSMKKDTQEMEATTTYNRDKLTSKINALDCFDEDKVVKPQNAYLKYENGSYTIEPAVQGNELREEKVITLIQEAIQNGTTEINLEKQDCYETPEFDETKQELVEAKDTMNKYIQSSITYDFTVRTEKLDSSTIKDWLSVDDDFQVVISEEKAIEYIKTLEQKYNTLGKSREFTTHDGKVITVPSGNYGYMISRSRELEQLISDIKSGKAVTREPVYAYEGYVRGEDDIGDTYVEIDLTQQKMWFYINGKVYVETDVVTGNESRDYGTPVGVYAITYKERDATLQGEDYSSPVKYWMPFNGNIGIHDASWRTTFGGEIYKTSGSHGCVNTPEKNAEKIFEKIEKGMPVIVHE